MTRMTGPDCAVMCNLINTHTHTTRYVQFNKYTHTHTHTRMTRPDCVVMCNLINTHTHTHKHLEQCFADMKNGVFFKNGRLYFLFV